MNKLAYKPACDLAPGDRVVLDDTNEVVRVVNVGPAMVRNHVRVEFPGGWGSVHKGAMVEVR